MVKKDFIELMLKEIGNKTNRIDKKVAVIEEHLRNQNPLKEEETSSNLMLQ